MPLTPNGKIDKRALPVPQVTEQKGEDVLADPMSPTEETLAQIWRDVLRIERFGVRDNFFALGGHSLLVTQVMSRVQETFQVEMTMRQFFEAPTISSLAAVIEETIVDQVSRMSDEQINRIGDNGVEILNGHRNGDLNGNGVPGMESPKINV